MNRFLCACLGLWASAAAIAQDTPPVRHDLRCDLDVDAGSMSVRTTVVAEAAWLNAGKIEFRLAALMEKPAVTIDGRPVTLDARSQEKEVHYSFAVPDDLRERKVAKLEFAYKNIEKNGFVFHLGPEGTFAGGYNTTWYPRFGSDRSIGKMTFEVSSAIVVKASGKQVSDTASGAKRQFVFDVPVPSVLTFAAAPYIVKKIDGKQPVTLYLLKDRPQAGDYVNGCWKIVNVLEKEFGPYPFPDFSIIETPSPISSQSGFSGASFEGFIFAASKSLDAPFNLAYFGHEIGHQWWGNLVQRRGKKGDYVMSEALAQYGSLRVVETLQGAQAAAQYRFSGYPGYSPNQCGKGAILMAPGGFDHPLANLPDDGASHQLANAKGFLAWAALARVMGKERFSRGLKRATKIYAWKAATFEELIAEIQRESPLDLGPYVQQWFERRGAPTLNLSWNEKDGALVVKVAQAAPYYLLDLPVEVRYADGSSSWHAVKLTAAQAELKVRAKGPVESVLLDPLYEVFHSTPELNGEAQAFRYASQSQILTRQGKDKEAEEATILGLRNLPEHDSWGVEFKLRFILAGMHRRAAKNQEAKEQYRAALLCPVRVDEDVPWIYLRLAQIAIEDKDEASKEWALRQMANADAALPIPSGASREAAALIGSAKA